MTVPVPAFMGSCIAATAVTGNCRLSTRPVPKPGSQVY